jgi:HlyD family secretion protein
MSRLLLLVLAAGLAACGLAGPRPREVPTARVQRGRVPIVVHAAGEVRARVSVPLVAPALDGTLQITHVAATGSRVRKGDVVCALDPAEQQHRLDESLSQLAEAQQDLARVLAEGEMQRGAMGVERLSARFAVRRAEMDVARSELLSAQEVLEHERALEERRQVQAQLEADFRAREAGHAAVLQGARDRVRDAVREVAAARENLERLKLRAPMDGLVIVKENTDGWGAFSFMTADTPAYRAGDTVASGRTLLEVIDPAQTEVVARVTEDEGATLPAGTPAEIRISGVPAARVAGRVKQVGLMATQRPWLDGGLRKLDVILEIPAHAAARPGVMAEVLITRPPLEEARYVPRQAVFEEQGRPVVYVSDGRELQARPVTIVRHAELHSVIEGLPEGALVALAPPGAARSR